MNYEDLLGEVSIMADNQARVKVLNEARKGSDDGWQLCYQWCRYEYGDGSEEEGFRFIWKREDGTLQAARGQARIPSTADALELIQCAMRSGWGGNYSKTDGEFEETECKNYR